MNLLEIQITSNQIRSGQIGSAESKENQNFILQDD